MHDPRLNNSICWYGSLSQFAETVLESCDRAVEFAPETDRPYYRDTRGLARALANDPHGAIDDFRAFVQWAQETGARNSTFDRYGRTRQEWIAALEAGRNPFADAAVLTALRFE